MHCKPEERYYLNKYSRPTGSGSFFKAENQDKLTNISLEQVTSLIRTIYVLLRSCCQGYKMGALIYYNIAKITTKSIPIK